MRNWDRNWRDEERESVLQSKFIRKNTIKVCCASLTQQGTPVGTWGSSAVLHFPLLLHLLWHSFAPPHPLYLPAPHLSFYTSLAKKLGCQMLLLTMMVMVMTLRSGCGGKAVVSCWRPEQMLPFHYDCVCCKSRAVCQVGPLQAQSVLKGPVLRSWAWQDLDLMKVETVQGREQPLHRGHPTADHLALVLWLSKVTKEQKLLCWFVLKQ